MMEMEGNSEIEEIPKRTNVQKTKLARCVGWLQHQNSLESKTVHNKNDIEFIIRTNAERKKFLLSTVDDDATVPAGIEEPAVEPKVVPRLKLRVEKLRMECEWQACCSFFSNYDRFQSHIRQHIKDLHVIGTEDSVEYVCLWDICGHKTSDFKEMVRHINYHAYHARLMAIGFNGRATLKLDRCCKDSSKRNQLPQLKCPHTCLWFGCGETFDSIQAFFDHVQCAHVRYTEDFLCSWAGCGATFARRTPLRVHARSHTRERLIACYHCGMHFANNRKLADHVRRQNVNPNTEWACSVCGKLHATEYLLRCHARQHISAYACAMCDMSAPTTAALAQHVRYRHMHDAHARPHACAHCDYRAVMKWDLKVHMRTHTRKKRRKGKSDPDDSMSDNSEEEIRKKQPKVQKKYACHMCPEEGMKTFTRGERLTRHLVKVHGAQWPFGHSRFRYQISEDGMYRLTTTRYEFLDVSEKIVDGSIPKELPQNKLKFKVKEIAEATKTAPKRFEITLKQEGSDSESGNSECEQKMEIEPTADNNTVEITMCDVDEDGNIISSKVIDHLYPDIKAE